MWKFWKKKEPTLLDKMIELLYSFELKEMRRDDIYRTNNYVVFWIGDFKFVIQKLNKDNPGHIKNYDVFVKHKDDNDTIYFYPTDNKQVTKRCEEIYNYLLSYNYHKRAEYWAKLIGVKY